MYVSKKSRLLAALRNNKKLTARQIMSKFDYESVNSVYGTISLLRQEGHNIVSTVSKRTGLNTYSIA